MEKLFFKLTVDGYCQVRIDCKTSKPIINFCFLEGNEDKQSLICSQIGQLIHEQQEKMPSAPYWEMVVDSRISTKVLQTLTLERRKKIFQISLFWKIIEIELPSGKISPLPDHANNVHWADFFGEARNYAEKIKPKRQKNFDFKMANAFCMMILELADYQ